MAAASGWIRHRVAGGTNDGFDIERTRVALIAASDRPEAEAAARARGIDPVLCLTGSEMVSSAAGLRSMFKHERVDAIVVHSSAWAAQSYPHVFEIALAIAPARQRYLLDGETNVLRRLSRWDAARMLGTIPLDLVVGGALTASEALRHAIRLARVRRPPTPHVAGQVASSPWVLAIWRGSADAPVGGSVTHISGVLGGFRQHGYRVGLVTSTALPEQLRAVVDEVEIVRRVPAGGRLTRDIHMLTVNGPLRDAAIRMAEKLSPAFVYQRHEFLLGAGTDLSRRLGIPLVLEWNASEVWARSNWMADPLGWLNRWLFLPLGTSVERTVVASADLVSAVSAGAAEMALGAGADLNQVAVLPNAVDSAMVPAGVPRLPAGSARKSVRLGWIGTLGPWHGAEIAVQALTRLPPMVVLRMIGDGNGRKEYQLLAESLGVSDRIEWTGRLPHHEALRRLEECDILLAPHVQLADVPFFGSPTKLFEYMALGRPIVASRLEQMAEILEHGRTALLAEPGDFEDLARTINDVLALPDRGSALGEEARAEVVKNHTWDQRAGVILSRLGIGCGSVNPPEEFQPVFRRSTC